MNHEIDIRNDQQLLDVSVAELTAALIIGLETQHVAAAVLSVTIVDNAAIQRMNRQHLQHDFPTDVISFPLEFRRGKGSRLRNRRGQPPPGEVPGGLRAAGATIEGEIVVSAEMACEVAPRENWPPLTELKLYLIHGMLHLCGYDDLTLAEQEIMRYHERWILSRLGLMPGERFRKGTEDTTGQGPADREGQRG